MALSANRIVDTFVDQVLRSYGVLTATHVYKGALVGVTAAGYARGLVAGDQCVGVAHEEINNTGASAAKSVRVMTVGDIEHAISGATVADVGRAVYASAVAWPRLGAAMFADDTLTFTLVRESLLAPRHAGILSREQDLVLHRAVAWPRLGAAMLA